MLIILCLKGHTKWSIPHLHWIYQETSRNFGKKMEFEIHHSGFKSWLWQLENLSRFLKPLGPNSYTCTYVYMYMAKAHLCQWNIFLKKYCKQVLYFSVKGFGKSYKCWLYRHMDAWFDEDNSQDSVCYWICPVSFIQLLKLNMNSSSCTNFNS